MNNEWWIDFVAGWVSGAVSVIACQPLDTILTRLQAAPGGKQIQIATATATTAGGTAAAEISSTKSSARTGSAIRGMSSLSLSTATITGRKLISNYGISSLWKGSSSMIGAVPFQNALLMSGYGFGKRYAAAYDNKNNNENTNTNTLLLLPVFIGGCVGGIVQSFLMSPIEWIKVNQQISITNTNNSNTTTAGGGTGTNVMKQFLQNKSKLWNRGLTATLLRDGIPHGVWFVSYEYCKTMLMSSSSVSEKHDDDNEEETSNSISSMSSSSSASSSSFYKTVTVPIVSGAFAATAAWVSLR